MESKKIIEVNSFFEQPWWLDAVAPDQWGEIIVKRGEDICARLPYVQKKKYGLKAITMPPYTQTLGPWLRPSEARYAKQISEQKDLMNELIAQLPVFDYFCQNFSPSITNWLPFFWAGFQQTTMYTYRINDLSDHERIWHDFLDRTRRAIRKAEKNVVVRSDLGLDQLIQVNAMTFDRQGLQLPYHPDLIANIDNACVAHNARRMFFAEDTQGRIHAAIYIVWDSETARYLLGGGDPALRQSGAHYLLIWEAIKFASTVSLSFDFEGSMIKPIEHFFRSFGAIQTPYYQISKMNRRMKIAYHGKELMKAMFKC